MAANSSAGAWMRALEMTAPIVRNGVIFPVLLDQLAARFGAAIALSSESDELTYRELADRSNRYARWALEQRVGRGDVVCLLMPNSAEYLAIWAGIARVGGIAALVNTQLAGDGLAHCVNLAAPRHLIVAAELADRIAAVRQALDPALRCWSHGAPVPGMARIDRGIDAAAGQPLDGDVPPPRLRDPALYIYTSGTTGLPKAAKVSHLRIMQWSHWFAGMMDAGPADRMYNCLPMYHSVGGVAAVGATLVAGGAVVLRRRFSTRSFWDDVVQSRCTLLQYIGEMCRYLVAAPSRPNETAHRLRLCCGNGLRADAWEAFERRFRIPRILEFYAATEGAFSLYNCEGRRGSIGRVPGFLRDRMAVELIKIDRESGEPLRDEAGFAIRCRADEVGEAIGRIGDGLARFEGYTDETASSRKVLRDVFARADSWYRAGDLMRRDADGFFFFVDRIGDAFRWKGENVSAAEVEQAIEGDAGVLDCAVYGVAVPGAEGRAGMAAIRVGDGIDLAELRRRLIERLPEYARPLFLRLRQEVELTGTYRPMKRRLADEGYDPAASADPVYFDDRTTGEYVRIDPALHRRIRGGNFRL